MAETHPVRAQSRPLAPICMDRSAAVWISSVAVMQVPANGASQRETVQARSSAESVIIIMRPARGREASAKPLCQLMSHHQHPAARWTGVSISNLISPPRVQYDESWSRIGCAVCKQADRRNSRHWPAVWSPRIICPHSSIRIPKVFAQDEMTVNL